MQFIVTGHDGTDAEAPARRAQARAAHLALGGEMAAAGTLLYAAALLDDAGQMRGSVMICDFPGRAALDAWLRGEPYVTGRVWADVQVQECRVAPAFQKKETTA